MEHAILPGKKVFFLSQWLEGLGSANFGNFILVVAIYIGRQPRNMNQSGYVIHGNGYGMLTLFFGTY